ncbi:MAG: hypothetical protein IT384_08545 [Deltaproteobacteria bacterium]|nr:hypothetical protein [Deltaproteobacteria bacterium]
MNARWLLALALGTGLSACEQPLTPDLFQKRAERTYAEVNAGFGVARRDGARSVMVRGDQLFALETEPLFSEYRASGRSASSWFDAWKEKLEADSKARRRSLAQAKGQVIPVIKSGAWIRVQDLGAIGPKSIQDQIRPWRKEITDDVYAVLGVPEMLLGYRLVTIQEVETSSVSAEEWLRRAVVNLVREVSTATGSVELKRDDGRPMVLDLPNKDGVAGLILDKGFRRTMLSKFGLGSLGAAVPNRDVLIVFDPEDFVTIKPIRARTHQLYDERNHPGFRGLLRFDEEHVSVLEPSRPTEPAVGN